MLYRLAAALHLGVVHTLFLTNLYVIALTAAVVFALDRQQRYGRHVAVVVALLFGLGTWAWPHSKLYFRDPLAMLFVASAWWSLERAFAPRLARSQLASALLTLVLLGLGALSKSTALLALAAFCLSTILRAMHRPALRRVTWLALIGSALGVGVLALLPHQGALGPLALATSLGNFLRSPALHSPAAWMETIFGLWLSPGKGLFVTSPALCLALLAWPLRKGHDRSSLLVPWLTLVSLTLGTLFYRGGIWFGGTGWGVRHLLPAVPLLATACAPAVQAWMRTPRRLLRIGGAALLLGSALLQLGGVLLHPDAYYAWLYGIRPDAAWTLAIWNPRYVEAVGYWRLLLAGQPLDLAWLRLWPIEPLPVAAVVLCAVAAMLLAGILLRRALAGDPRWQTPAVIALGVFLCTILPYGLLRVCYPDPYYYAGRQDFRRAAAHVTRSAQPGDVIVIRGYTQPLWRFFVNYVYSPVAWYAYDPSPPMEFPEATLPEVAAGQQTLSPPNEDLFSQLLPDVYRRMWLVNDGCAAGGDLYREEHWLSAHQVPLDSVSFFEGCEIKTSLFAFVPSEPARSSALHLRFAQGLRLTRLTQLAYAGHATPEPGDLLMLQLGWKVARPPTTDYSVSVQLLDEEGRLCAQQDSMPGGGYMPMTEWPTGQLITDTRGVQLPSDLPPGDYTLAVAVYDWETGERLPVRASGQPEPKNLGVLGVLRVDGP